MLKPLTRHRLGLRALQQRRTLSIVATTPKPQHFEYRELDKTTSEIRLLKLLPRNEKSPNQVQVELQHYDIDDCDCPQYAALSYRWGSLETRKGSILLDGREFAVQSTVFEFLMQLQSHQETSNLTLEVDAPQYLWIDGLCIDQANVSERNHQVQLMKAIYSTAVYVYLWLGETEREVGTSIVGMFPESLDRACREFAAQGWTSLQGYPQPIGAILKLAQNEYWRRTWIVQEVLLAQRIHVFWGAAQFGLNNTFWTLFLKPIGVAMQPRSKNPRMHGRTMGYGALGFGRCARSMNTLLGHLGLEYPQRAVPDVWDWQDLLTEFGSNLATDPRDKVYGLMGLVRDPMQVDYSKGLGEIYEDATRRMAPENGDPILVVGTNEEDEFSIDGAWARGVIAADRCPLTGEEVCLFQYLRRSKVVDH